MTAWFLERASDRIFLGNPVPPVKNGNAALMVKEEQFKAQKLSNCSILRIHEQFEASEGAQK